MIIASRPIVNGSERLSREGRCEAPREVLLKHKVGHVLLRHAKSTYFSVLRSCVHRTRVYAYTPVPDVAEANLFCYRPSVVDRMHRHWYVGFTTVFITISF